MLNEWLPHERLSGEGPSPAEVASLRPATHTKTQVHSTVKSKTSKNYLSSPWLINIADICSCCT